MPGGAGPVQGLLTLLARQAICAALATARMQPSLSCASSLWMSAAHSHCGGLYTQLNTGPSLAFMHGCGGRLWQRVGKLAESTSVARRCPLCLLWTARASSRAAGGRSLGAH